MPWEHCGESILDDVENCPTCGISKTAWTLQWNVTRTFQVSGPTALLKIRLLQGEEELPVEGEPYRVELPDGNVVEGTLDESGYAKVRSGAAGDCALSFPERSPGEVRVQLEEGEAEGPAESEGRFTCPTRSRRYSFTLGSAWWSTDRARSGDEVTMTARFALADGTPATFVIYEQDADGNDDLMEEVEGNVEGGRAVATWNYRYVPDDDDMRSEQDANTQYTLPEFYFLARADGREARSGLLEFRNWVDLCLEDPEGNPLANVGYVLSLSDGSEREGTTDEEGHLHEEEIPPGPVHLRISGQAGEPEPDLDARWSADSARTGDEVTLILEAEGVPDGTPVAFTIYEQDADGDDDLMAELEGTVEGGRAEATWTYEYVTDEDDERSEQDADTEYTAPEYYFLARVDEREARSDLLEFSDWVDLCLEDPDGNPLANTGYLLVLPDGSERRGTTDEEGHLREEEVPPGPVSLQLVAAEAEADGE